MEFYCCIYTHNKNNNANLCQIITFVCEWCGLKLYQASKPTQKCCSSLVAAYSKVVALVVLFMSHVLGTEWYAHFTIWRYRQRNFSIWRNKNDFRLLRRLLWVSPQSFRYRRCCSYCVSHFFCLSFCVLYWETEFSKEVNVIKMYPHIWMLQLL